MIITKEQEKLIRQMNFQEQIKNFDIIEALKRRNANKKKLIELLDQSTKKESKK